MSEPIQKLEYLIGLKKIKKDPNKLERDEFYQAWISLAMEEGFSERVEFFLYSGFTYCGAKPYWDCCLQTDESVSELEKLYEGKLYGENCASTSQILIHLISLELNRKESNLSILISLMRHLPLALKNKEGKIYGQAGRALKKYLYDELKPNAVYPEIKKLFELGLDKYEYIAFKNAISSIMGTVDYSGYSKKCQDNIMAVNSWLELSSEYSVSETASAKSAIDSPSIESEQEVVKPDVEEDNLKTEIDLKIIESELIEVKKQKEQIEKECINEALKASKLQKKVDLFAQEVEGLRNSNLIYAKKEEKLTEEIAQYKRRITDLKEKINLVNGELSERMKMIEMLRRDRTKQSSNSLNRLASKLRSYYDDYVSATEIEMSTALGENLRDQMGEVFKILEEGGISIK